MKSQAHETDQEPQRILLAEDDELIRELVSTYLTQLGFHVKEASNGAVAMDIMLESPRDSFDLIVTDMLMPKATGEEIVQKARDSGVCNRFILMSGNALDRERKGASGCAFLEKPFTFSEFSSKLNALLERDGKRIPDKVLNP